MYRYIHIYENDVLLMVKSLFSFVFLYPFLCYSKFLMWAQEFMMKSDIILCYLVKMQSGFVRDAKASKPM